MREYFEKNEGLGILSTADRDGNVNAAVYSRPNFLDEKTVAFIMPDRLTHANLGSNPRAVYLFVEQGTKARGKRLYLNKTREEKNSETIERLRRSSHGDPEEDHFLVVFSIERVLPLLGA